MWLQAIFWAIGLGICANLASGQGQTGPAGSTLQANWLWIRTVTGSPSVGEYDNLH